MPTLSRIAVTPVKALGLLHPDRVALEDVGIRGNRRFFLLNERGRLVSDKRYPTLLRVRPAFDPATEWLELRFPDGSELSGDTSDLGEAISVDFYGRSVDAHLVEGPLSAGISRYAGTPLRLARCDREGDGPDVHRLSLVSWESVAELARRGGRAEDLDPRRFRMNLELSGCGPHEEDEWEGRRVRVGAAVIRVHGKVPRCAITTLNPITGEKDFETLKVIPTYRPLMRDGSGRGIPFGMYAEVEEPGEVGLGDPVEPLP
jgi:hypothetical protein